MQTFPRSTDVVLRAIKTRYTHSLRQFYRECDIYGTVDFIFGNAAAIFQNCSLFARKPLPDQKNIFTAQGRSDPNQNTGIVEGEEFDNFNNKIDLFYNKIDLVLPQNTC